MVRRHRPLRLPPSRVSGVDQPAPIDIRPAVAGDAEILCALFLAARRAALPDLPRLHTDAETQAWMERSVIHGGGTMVAVRAGRCVGFVAVAGAWVEHLYVAPEAQGQGIGRRLLAVAKQQSPSGLSLYVFQDNRRARRFYEQQGFMLVAETDGAGNEEQWPDALYRWPSMGKP